ncbi:MAG: PqqD family peptide modification chaperone, partial [Clostridia bacterium]|nr:PqqD family peptide modification chaperone [Clostridia bacterium]
MIHQFKNNGFAFVVDTASGAVHSVDDVAYDVIAMYEDHDEDEIVRQITEKYGIDGDEVKECLADVRELVDRGLLFSEDEFRDLPPKNGKSTVKALCLH